MDDSLKAAAKRAETLLRAVRAFIAECEDSHYVLSILEADFTYDDVTSDGYCLGDDIDNALAAIERSLLSTTPAAARPEGQP